MGDTDPITSNNIDHSQQMIHHHYLLLIMQNSCNERIKARPSRSRMIDNHLRAIMCLIQCSII